MNLSTFILSRPVILFFVLLILAGCATRPPVADLPVEYQLQKIGTVSAGSPLVWHPDARRYAVVDRGLSIRQLEGEGTEADQQNPLAIAWSPTGAFLAASFSADDNSLIRIYDAGELNQIVEIPVGGQVRDLAWVDDEQLLFAAVSLKRFAFGGNYSVRLYRWRQNEELTSEVIVDTSPLKSTLDLLGDSISKSIDLQLSPCRDEITFNRLISPPNVSSHFQLVVRHLVSGQERLVAKLPFASRGGRYLKGCDYLFYSDGQYQSIAGPIWGTESYDSYAPGLHLESSPGGRYKIIDQQLLRDQAVLLHFNNLDNAAFSPDGARLLFTADRSLYLLSPLDDQTLQPAALSARLLEMRRWRSQGLITPQEFEQQLKNLESR